MKTFHCGCGQQIFFDNTWCTNCGSALGFDPTSLQLLSFDVLPTGEWQSANHFQFKPCQNYTDYKVCNWVLPYHSGDQFCVACSLNEMIPALTADEKHLWWESMEMAKRRLLYSLLSLQLPVENKSKNSQGLAFAFLEDKRMNPAVEEEYVATGYKTGLITVNLAEADDISRETTRVEMNEPYRTLLGHFRHESGHYYFEKLVQFSSSIDQFRHLFGDETQDYNAALNHYYQNYDRLRQQFATNASQFISCYAQAHPLEDWAECWAHYLHMVDTLETAAEFGLISDAINRSDFQSLLQHWGQVTVALNALNRSMGLRDAYPFVLSEAVITKILFVHQVIDPR